MFLFVLVHMLIHMRTVYENQSTHEDQRIRTGRAASSDQECAGYLGGSFAEFRAACCSVLDTCRVATGGTT